MRKLMATAAVLAASAGMLAFSAPSAGSYERWLRIHNETSYDLCYVHISNVGTDNWGPDILGNNCLSPGRYRTVDPGWQQGYCRMDMKFIFDDDDEVTEWGFNICEGTDYYLTN